MTAIKADDKSVGDVVAGDVMSEFRGYNLADLGLPRSARPRAGFPYAGKHGYTMKAQNGAVTRSNGAVIRSISIPVGPPKKAPTSPKIFYKTHGKQCIFWD